MSLDVYLKASKPTKTKCHHCESEHDEYENLFEANITHNLGKMAKMAGIYQHLWRPEELGITKASELIDPLKKGLADMKERPEYYERFNESNGWGLHKHFVPWVEKYLDACSEYPDAIIGISR